MFYSLSAPGASKDFDICGSMESGLVTGKVPPRRVTFVRSTGARMQGGRLFSGMEENTIHVLVNDAFGVKTNAGIRSLVVTDRSLSYP